MGPALVAKGALGRVSHDAYILRIEIAQSQFGNRTSLLAASEKSGGGCSGLGQEIVREGEIVVQLIDVEPGASVWRRSKISGGMGADFGNY